MNNIGVLMIIWCLKIPQEENGLRSCYYLPISRKLDDGKRFYVTSKQLQPEKKSRKFEFKQWINKIK